MNNNLNYGTVDFHAHPIDSVFRDEMRFLGIDPCGRRWVSPTFMERKNAY